MIEELKKMVTKAEKAGHVDVVKYLTKAIAALNAPFKVGDTVRVVSGYPGGDYVVTSVDPEREIVRIKGEITPPWEFKITELAKVEADE